MKHYTRNLDELGIKEVDLADNVAVEAINQLGSHPAPEGAKPNGATPESSPEDWIIGSRRKLTKALGRSEGYSNYLEREEAAGVLAHKQPERRHGKHAIRLYH